MENLKKSFHVFIIPDGNRRWAKKHRLPPWQGHQKGYEVFKNIAEEIWSFGVTHFTWWALSKDNFEKRKPEEICFLISLIYKALDELPQLLNSGKIQAQLRVVGRRKEILNNHLIQEIEDAERKTSHHKDRILTLLIGYDGKDEMEEAFTQFRKNVPSQNLACLDDFRHYLWTSYLPEVDICIRTDKEIHLSAGALSTQMHDTHLFSPDMHWPDFTTKELKKIINEFKRRQRRFGA